MKAPPLKLQNRFEELHNYDTSEQVATGSTPVTTLEGASSIKKRGVDKSSTLLDTLSPKTSGTLKRNNEGKMNTIY